MCVRNLESASAVYPLDPLARIVSKIEVRVMEKLRFQHRVHLQEFRPRIAHSFFLMKTERDRNREGAKGVVSV